MNRAFSARGAPVNRFEFTAPVSPPLSNPKFIQSTAIPITPPEGKAPTSPRSHSQRTASNNQRFSQSQRSPIRPTLPGLNNYRYSKNPPKPPRESTMRSISHRLYTGSPTESRRGIAAAQQIRDYMIHFDKLIEMTNEYIKMSPFYGSYVDDVKKLKDAYDVFVSQGSLHFSTKNPDDDPRPTFKTTPIYRSAKALLGAWATYIESTNAIESEGMAPHLQKVNESFDLINQTIQRIRKSMPNIRYRTDVSCVSMETFQTNANALREELADQFLAPTSVRFKEFDENHFQHQITYLTRQIFEIYSKALPNSCLPLAVKIQTRTQLSTAVADISTSVLSAKQCEGIFNSMKGEIILANQRLTSIFQRMNFPFSVSLIFDDDKLEATQKSE